MSDVNIIINVMLGKETSIELQATCDINEDNEVDVSDVNNVINILLGKNQ